MKTLFRHYRFVDFATQGYNALVGSVILLFHNDTIPIWAWLVTAHVVAAMLIHTLIEAHARRPAQPVLNFLRHFYPVLLYTGFFRETGAVNRIFFTEYLDPMVIRWEQALFGCQPSVLFMAWLPWLPVSELFYAAYFSYYVMISGVGLALFLRDRRQFFHYVSVVSFLFYMCYAIYCVVPVIGPRVFFREIEGYHLPDDLQALAVTDVYPDAVKAGVFFKIMAWIYKVFEAPGAALPSSHVAVAICTLYFSRRYLPRIRHVHAVTVVLLCASTVYCRYHYVVDVLAGVLTAVVLIPLANRLYWKLEREPLAASAPAPDAAAAAAAATPPVQSERS
ncbi:MAG: phosphatase PAP2 family protein [Verrucomicrobiae bacterium]|nr:phosphatase PAP2 family protein [Verrucomicrobiae bacterium]MDW8308965.1 phosphatase PAP2 family protein [Verrucomicrobiales bacterium]